jgi:hypothetical protein
MRQNGAPERPRSVSRRDDCERDTRAASSIAYQLLQAAIVNLHPRGTKARWIYARAGWLDAPNGWLSFGRALGVADETQPGAGSFESRTTW